MSTCTRCGATFHCAVDQRTDPRADGHAPAPCWCTLLPAAVAVPASGQAAVGCWCPACLKAHIAAAGS